MLSRYRIGVLEDEALIAESLQDILEALGHQHLFTANNGQELLTLVEQHDVELLLLDIKVKGDLDGVETAKRVSNLKKVPYIFTTAYADEATIERVKNTAPYGYVVKPYGIKEIQVAIQLAMLNSARALRIEPSEPSANHLFVKDNKTLTKVAFTDLLFVEAQGDYVLLQMVNSKKLILSTLKKLLSKLPNEQFMQVHRSYIVNLSAITAIHDGSIVIGTKHIPVSKSKLDSLVKKLNFL